MIKRTHICYFWLQWKVLDNLSSPFPHASWTIRRNLPSKIVWTYCIYNVYIYCKIYKPRVYIFYRQLPNVRCIISLLYTHSLTHSLSLSLTYIHGHTHTHTHRETHTQSFSHSLSLSLSLSLNLFLCVCLSVCLSPSIYIYKVWVQNLLSPILVALPK